MVRYTNRKEMGPQLEMSYLSGEKYLLRWSTAKIHDSVLVHLFMGC